MGLGAFKVLSFGNKFRVLKYSLGSKLVNSVPKGLKHTYDFLGWLQGKGISIEKKDGLITFQYPIKDTKYAFAIDEISSDSDVFNQIMVEEEYQYVTELMSKHNIEVKTVIDAGANVGYTAIYLSHFYKNMQLIALEPNTETFRRLKLNMDLNNLDHVILHQKGLWNKNTFLKPDHSFRDGQAWSFRLEETTNEAEKLFEVTSINSLMEEHQLANIDFLKIDVEGGEKEIFNAEADLSWLQKVKVIAIEIHDEFECREDIEGILKQQFELFYSGELTIGIHTSCLK
ncbi:MAG: FkbM family methyltransferase [Crocinitomicaceae bacterium]|nr:FkbM family methyltransferase [Crocinitomicaceae bacterium]